MVKSMFLPSVFPGKCTRVGGQGFQVVSGQEGEGLGCNSGTGQLDSKNLPQEAEMKKKGPRELRFRLNVKI